MSKLALLSQTRNEFGPTGELREARKSGVNRSSANLMNGILGSGILYVPKSLENSGFVFGMLLLLMICLISDYVSVQIVKMAKIKKVKSLQELSSVSWGEPLFYSTCLFCFLFSYGALIGYIQIISSICEFTLKFYSSDFIQNNAYLFWLVPLIIVVLIIMPLSLLPDLSMLSFTSILSLATFVAIIIITTYSASTVSPHRTSLGSVEPLNFLSSVGSISFSMVCLDSILPVYGSLEDATQSRWNRVTHISLGTLFLVYAAFSSMCYFLLPDVENYVLDTPSISSKPEIFACKILLCITIILTYPVNLHYARSYITPLFKTCLGPINQLSKKKYTVLHVCVTLGILITTVALGITVKALDSVISMTGLIASTVVGFVIPVMIIVKVRTFAVLWGDFRQAFVRDQTLGKRLKKFSHLALPIFIVLFGMVAFFVGIPVEIVSIVRKIKSNQHFLISPIAIKK